VEGGQEGEKTYYICRAEYANGMHPGKIVGGRCNIGYGGNEIEIEQYEVLVGNVSFLVWASTDHYFACGRIGSGDHTQSYVIGGWENNQNLYICKGRLTTGLFNKNRGEHSGKLIGGRCNIGYGGNEYELTDFRVLSFTRSICPTP